MQCQQSSVKRAIAFSDVSRSVPHSANRLSAAAGP